MLHYQLLVTNNKLSQGLPNQIITMFDVFCHTNMQQCKSNGGHQPERDWLCLAHLFLIFIPYLGLMLQWG